MIWGTKELVILVAHFMYRGVHTCEESLELASTWRHMTLRILLPKPHAVPCAQLERSAVYAMQRPTTGVPYQTAAMTFCSFPPLESLWPACFRAGSQQQLSSSSVRKISLESCAYGLGCPSRGHCSIIAICLDCARPTLIIKQGAPQWVV